MPRKRMAVEDHRSLIDIERRKLAMVDRLSCKVAVRVSGGAASSVAWKRSIDRWGKSRVFAVFADTNSEDEDTYRFLRDCEDAFEHRLLRLSQSNDDGSPMDIWDCFDKHGVMRIPKAGNACKASIELKQKPLDRATRLLNIPVVAIGYGFDEPERVRDFKAKYTAAVSVYPLVEDPVLSACELTEQLEEWGIDPPAVYEDGFVHNNCLGAGGCILSGLAQFAAVRKLKRRAFDYARKRERPFHERTGFTVLRDQRNGEVKSYTLDDLDRDAEGGRDFGDQWMSNCNCMAPMLFTSDELFGHEAKIDETPNPTDNPQ